MSNDARRNLTKRLAGRRLCFLAVAACLAGLLVPQARGQAEVAPEYNVKAAFLTRFAKYIEWPGDASGGGNTPIIIGVLGADPFGDVLDKTAREQAAGRPLVIRRVANAREALGCQIVFIGRSESAAETGWLAALRGKPIVTVGESGHTIERGGVLEFEDVAGHVRFNASLPAIQAAGVKISSEMLGRAAKVFKTAAEAR